MKVLAKALTGLSLLLLLGAAALVAQQPPLSGTTPRRAPARVAATPPVGATQSGERKYKGIWEPINYKEDVEFTDVYFVTPEEGWATGLHRTEAGEGGFILHTLDGGLTW